MEECQQERHDDAGRLKTFQLYVHHQQSCFRYKVRDPVASLGGGGGQMGDSRQGQNRFLHRWTGWTDGRTEKH